MRGGSWIAEQDLKRLARPDVINVGQLLIFYWCFLKHGACISACEKDRVVPGSLIASGSGP